ncbi:MAG TPA: SpoIIE family protein phosphatase [Spirochaetota bacterium]|nr:SpoIIE family protein phosphatase [Spirochaetota bacterium]HQH97670.1 SpoIIE family protein phosphatase [Spirochaetota bacterium]
MMRTLTYIFLCILLSSAAASADAGTEINLSGVWNYCFIDSEKDYPPREGTPWESITIPDRYLFETIAAKKRITRGYILYRKTVPLEEDVSRPLVFQAGEIMNADIVYINGEKIGKTGMFPPDFKSGWSKFRNYPIPPGLLKKGGNTIDIVNYFDAELWILSPMRIIDERRGNRHYMVRNFLQIEFIQAFFILLLSFSLLFLAIYLKRKKEMIYFNYACATFFLADMMLLQFFENTFPYMPVSSNTVFKICGVGLIFFPPFLTLFFRSYLELKITGTRIAVYLVLPVALTLLMVVSQDRHYIIYWRNIFLLLIPLYIADIVIMSIRQIMAGNRKGLMLFIVLLPIFAFGIYDILVFSLHLFEGSVPLYPLGVPFMLVLLGLDLINRFVYNLNTAEELNVLLREKMDEGKRLAFLENEISIARTIQLAALPHELPESTAFTIGVKYIPAANISGDFYNFHCMEEEKIGVLIADVSGHGVPASLIASMIKVLFSTLAPVCSRPGDFMEGLNAYIFDKMEKNYLTAGYCYINRPDKKGYFVRAGHEPLLHIAYGSGEAVLNEYCPKGMAIGFIPRIDLELHEFAIGRGDRVVLYTDCLTESFNDERELFGDARLKDLVMESKHLPPVEAVEFIFNALKEWSSPGEFQDDFTLIIVDVN